ncbi:hypothetical protein HHL16_16275 [Pseudoflavitalea sp. G-6-1-2]|uniref:hypothetical protein n=1 Tax=Pseudoflavitalea sp. G-6-1-2 TaxID=2728841 RepID=UPI00146E7920|nr:hypothetical protein [Pseudoflavitalea sp. G-6-1-2]NML22442.1 hypothetical protein [Pseudoflavitalea sp. G-6-1-2]
MKEKNPFKRLEELGYTIVVYPASLKLLKRPMFPEELATTNEMLSKGIFFPPELQEKKS